MTYKELKITRRSPHLGAFVEGVNLHESPKPSSVRGNQVFIAAVPV